MRGRIAGIVEATGAVEVRAEGFRAERARPHALMIGRRDPAHVRRLAARYGGELILPGPQGVARVLAGARAGL